MVRFKRVWMQFMIICGMFTLLTYLLLTPEFYSQQQMRKEEAVACSCQQHIPHSERTSNYSRVFQDAGNSVIPQADISVKFPHEAYGQGSSILYGRRRKKGFLTIGIPSVRRPYGRDYLQGTLQSIINKTNDKEKLKTTVVIFLADFDSDWNKNTADDICTKYKEFCESGFFHIIQSHKSIYPDFTKLQKRSDETPERVQWRSKQNIDYALLMLYALNISEYYIQIEDDVVCAANFISDISQFVNRISKWICIEFSGLGFIGKLFRSYHLQKVASHLLTFYDTLPCDLLLGYIFRILGQKKPIHFKHSLFQHTGRWSSLPKKMMPSIDKSFKDFGKHSLSITDVPKGDNPSAKIESTMNDADGSKPENAYSNSSLYYMASGVKRHSYYRIIFKNGVNLNRIIVSTGESNTHKYALSAGELIISYSSSCQKQVTIGRLIDGEFDTAILELRLGMNIKCITLMAQSAQNEVMIRQISVFLEPKLQNLH